jgi:beta-galactosidase GanA
LIVDGKPFLIRGGELGNSSASSLSWLAPHWKTFRELRLNTIVAPVYWDLVEAEEGRFDWTLVDGLIAEARTNEMRLVLLWFGSWKNSMSCYAPAWVKRDQARFPRSVDASGHTVEILSPFSTANRDTDARAFAALMRHLKTFDGEAHTVVMVQVENEIGMIPSARDYAHDATALFAGEVPAELMAYLQQHAGALAPELDAAWRAAGARRAGTWTEVFGPGPATDEIFMAWHFARFTQHVTAAGKAEYAVPMYVNAALIRPGYQPGQYPSAGPLPHLIDVWRAGARPSTSSRPTSTSRPSSSGRGGMPAAAIRSSFRKRCAAPKRRRIRCTRSASTTRSASRRSPSRRSPARPRPCSPRATTCSRRSARSSPSTRAAGRWPACCRSMPTIASPSRCV